MKPRYGTNNSRAVQQLVSWFRAVDIPVSDITDDSLTIIATDGRNIDVITAQDTGTEALIDRNTAIIPATISGLRVSQVMRFFHSITRIAGYGEPVPVDRGTEPVLKATHKDFDLTVIRHREFRRAPNPTPESLARCTKTINSAVRNFLRNNHKICAAHGHDIDDLLSYGHIWAVNFLGLHDLPSQYSNQQNILYSYIKQRLKHFLDMLHKKERGKVKAGEDPVAGVLDIDTCSYILPEYVAPSLVDGYLDLIEEKNRRLRAKAMLRKELKSMPHDQLVFTLTRISSAQFHDCSPDTRQYAAQILAEHKSSCPVCSTEEHKQSGTIYLDGGTE